MLAADAAAMLRSIQGVVGIRFVTALGSLTCRQSAVYGLQPAGAHHFEQTREVKQQATEARQEICHSTDGCNTCLHQKQMQFQQSASMQIRSGQIIDFKGRLMQIQKYQHTQGSGRQLGNVQASSDFMIRVIPAFVHVIRCSVF